MGEGDRGVLPVSTFFPRRRFSSQPYARLLRHTFSARLKPVIASLECFSTPFISGSASALLVGGACVFGVAGTRSWVAARLVTVARECGAGPVCFESA